MRSLKIASVLALLPLLLTIVPSEMSMRAIETTSFQPFHQMIYLRIEAKTVVKYMALKISATVRHVSMTATVIAVAVVISSPSLSVDAFH